MPSAWSTIQSLAHSKMLRTQQHNMIIVTVTLLVMGVLFTAHTNGVLLYPASTVLQLTSTMSVPTELLHSRKMFIDLGFQMNYNMPFSPSSFYNAAIWENELERGKRDLANRTAKYGRSTYESGIHPSDFSAGELYAGVERLLQDHGFHHSCLERSVCELALHPFDTNHKFDLVIQVMTFLLTPSQHDGFTATEKLYRDRYERAEQLGFLGGNCRVAYPKCKLDVLSIVTKLDS